MTPLLRRFRLGRGSPVGQQSRPIVPPDPRATLRGPLDPLLRAIRSGLVPLRRRLWIRRIVRRAWLVLAIVLAAESTLWAAARIVPLEFAPALAAGLPVLGALGLAVLAARSRPSIGETAIAVDCEAGLLDRLTSSLSLAAAVPGAAGPAPDASADPTAFDASADPDGLSEEERFVRRQRRDAVTALAGAPRDLFRPRTWRAPIVAALALGLLLVPLLVLPNAMDQRIAGDRRIREEAVRQAEKVTRIAENLAAKGVDAKDPRTRLAQELRDLALQLRDRPGDLDANLARLGSVEGDLRAAIDPATEQRASALASLSRALSSASTGKPDANRDGDPTKAAEDLAKAADELEKLTPEQRAELARRLTELQGTASQASGAAGVAAREAAQSLSGGDIMGARDALDRLAHAVSGTDRSVATNRDLAGAASRLQDSRRDLANAGGPGDQVAGQPAASGQPGQGSGRGQGSPRPSAGSGQGQGQGQGSGQGQGQGSGQGRGSIGGGGSNAAYLGSGTSSAGGFRGPTAGNKPSLLGQDLRTVYAPFDRLGRPGDPSYVSGTGGDGQTQQGNQTGSGSTNPVLTPYERVYADFRDYAITTLDRTYIPLSAKDYVRDYFSSLDPSQ